VRPKPPASPSMQFQLTRRKKNPSTVVGLDIEAGSVAAAEVRQNGEAPVSTAAVEPLAPGVFHEGEVVDPDRLAGALKDLFGKNKLAKDVRLGIGNQRVIVRMLRLPAIEDRKELEAAIRFQAQEQIPMPLDQAVLEHQVVGGVPAEDGAQPQLDVVVVAARQDMVRSFLEPIRSAGLQPVGVDLSAFGMIRALAVEGNGDGDGAVLYCNVGDAINLAVARRRACLFTRVSSVGLEGITTRLGAEAQLSAEHAVQWLRHVGLEPAVEEIEGDPALVSTVRRVLEEGVGGIVDELRLSLDYYGAQEGAVPVNRVVLSGEGSAIPGLAARVEELIGRPVSVSRPPALAEFDESTAARLTLPFGIALEH
jgi:type IV pilus assembly protein PilM